jgi:signal transduction histidine kinase/FixJ family two-component response regulator
MACNTGEMVDMPAAPSLYILHVECNQHDADLVRVLLVGANYDCRMQIANTRESVEKALRERAFDLILSDYTLPALDGATVLKLAAQYQPQTPFLFVSSTVGEELAVEMLKSGATDFVLKHSLPRLVPAVRRALKERDQRLKARRIEEALLVSERRFRFLAEASQILASSLNFRATLPLVARLAVPQLADWCIIHTVDGDANGPSLAVSHNEDAKANWARAELLKRPQMLGALHGSPGVLETREPVLIPDLSGSRLLRSADVELMRGLGSRSYLCVPLIAREQVLGSVALIISDSQRKLGQLDLELAQDLARRAATAIDTARLYQAAQEAIRAREEFLSIASHELKTPLTTLQLEVQMLLRAARKACPEVIAAPAVVRSSATGSGEQQAVAMSSVWLGAQGLADGALLPQYVASRMEVLEQQARKLSKLINNLLDVSRIDAGRFEIRREEVDLARVTKALIARFKQQSTLTCSALEFYADEAVIGMWDRLRIEQMVTNLLANALKYGRGKPVEVRVEKKESKARLSVTDHGIGIPPEHVGRIFDRFARATETRSYGGLGLGLYIVKQIVDALDGTVSVNSEVGAGSTFTVELPLKQDSLVHRE